MLYTRKGDTGTTKTFGCDQRISKSSPIAEALGSLDEINSFLGLVKVTSHDVTFVLSGKKISVSEMIGRIQQDLFIIQAELAGAEKTIAAEKVLWLESIVDSIEKALPPITAFFVSGGTELTVRFDIARTIVRRAERRVIGVVDASGNKPKEDGGIVIGVHTLAYLNRLSSVFYACARMINLLHGVVEESPTYD
ncbi:MAG: cob(I)yrinic acid a,c-diamide adenosyltransferase [Candidatus Pacebacteria bacterium]|nr:cob(I)yrinic acid a,c-diamide adenosyltransferase [Candidatus Paceibacterota bacterium]